MIKPLDPDLKALRACVKALQGSSCPRMLRANMDYLWDRFVAHPTKEDARP
jgi:hypothetical protein